MTTTKKYYRLWETYVAKILSITPVPISETKSQQVQRMAELEADPEKWFKYYFPGDNAQPADFHKAATRRIMNNPEWYEVRLWSRELAKSTRTMMEVLYLTLVGHPPTKNKMNSSSFETASPALFVGRMPRNGVCNASSQTPSQQPNVGAENLLPTHTSTPLSHPSLSHSAIEPLSHLKKSHVLLISSSLDNASRLLIPYKANLEHNPRITNDYGLQQNYGKWTATEFTTKKGISFRAIGADQPPRGAKNENNVRPDIILFDDIDTDSDCRNPEMINKTWKWIEEAAISTRSISKATTIIFCGNRIAVDCCVVRACKFADHVDEINIVDENGNPSWPQKNTKEHIARVLSQKSYASAQKEYFNNPVTEGAVFKQMHYKPMPALKEYTQLVCYTDPSFKEGPKNDYKATVLVGKWHDEFHIIKCFVEQTSTAQMIDWHYQIMHYLTNPQNMVIARNEATSQQHELRNMSPFRDGENTSNPLSHGAIESLSDSPLSHSAITQLSNYNSCYYYIEDVLLQNLLLEEFYKESRKRNKTIPIMGDQRKKGHKYTRIEALLEPLHRNSKLYLNAAEKDNPHMKRLEDQFLAFAPGSRAHDDAPDAVEGAIWIINNKETVKKSGTITIIKRRPSSKHF